MQRALAAIKGSQQHPELDVREYSPIEFNKYPQR